MLKTLTELTFMGKGIQLPFQYAKPQQAMAQLTPDGKPGDSAGIYKVPGFPMPMSL